MNATIKCIDLMSIHHPYACLDKESYITVRHVENQKEVRLSRTKGNVNLTDYWLSMLDNLAINDMSCSCQNIGLFSDIPANSSQSWWIEQENKYICIGFLKISSDANMSINEAMDGLKQQINDNGKIFRTLDNADIIIAMTTDTEEDLDCLVKSVCDYKYDGKSIYFSRYFIYGKCKKEDDVLKVENLKMGDSTVNSCQKHPLYTDGWCEKLRKEILSYINSYKEKRNKKMMSYYQALLQILNVLGQYEQATIHKDLFYIFYPPISVFISQLNKSQGEVHKLENLITSYNENSSERRDHLRKREKTSAEIERSISQFLDTMELLMHHIGQSCEEILGNTGHGGMPYDIPLRITLMYISYLNILTDVLIEEGNQNTAPMKFEYILSPLAYAQPATSCFHIGDTENTKLIRVKMPRHILFMPRPFFVILAHEASHYAHESSRERALRAKCMRKIAEHLVLTILISDGVNKELNENNRENNKDCIILEAYIKTLSTNLQNYLENTIYSEFEQKFNSPHKYQLNIAVEKICDICYRILYDEHHDLEKRIYDIDMDTANKLREAGANSHLFETIKRIQRSALNNAAAAACDNHLYSILNSIKRNFKEIYADLSAVRLLNLNIEDYLEAYVISESCYPDVSSIPPETLNRFAIVKYILESDNAVSKKTGTRGKKKNSQEDASKLHQTIEKYQNKILRLSPANSKPTKKTGDNRTPIGTDWFYYKPILDLEIEFFTKCNNSLKNHMNQSQIEDKLNLLRGLHKCFDVLPQNEDGSFAEFFKAYDALTGEYKKSVNAKYQSDLKELNS